MYLWSCSRVCVDSFEVVKADVDEEVVSVEHIEREAEGMLHLPQVGQHVYVERGDHSGDPNEDQDEADL